MHTKGDSEQPSFELLLAEYHEAVARGVDEIAFLEAAGDLPDELRERLLIAGDCVRQLHAAWHGEGGATRTPKSDLTPLPKLSRQASPAYQRIGRFRIERELGRGGAGVVFLGVDPQLGRPVAIKVPLPEVLIDPQLRQRFLREGEIAARLSHPNLLPVYETGEAGPVCYIAVAYCAGPNLAVWLREQRRIQPVTMRTIASVMVQLAEGVQHAHARGVLHRDLKPSNVLLEPVEACQPDRDCRHPHRLSLSDYVPKVADFGLAKFVEETSDHTRTGMVLGTLLYMSPEQAEGRTRDISVQSDVYALGAILYELLTGSPPLRGESDRATLQQILLQEPVRPSRTVRNVPPDLEAICLKCLEKDPRRRYFSAQQLANDLQRYLDGRPTAARPPRVAEKIWKWARRRPALATLALLSTAALLTALLTFVLYDQRLRQEVDRADRERDRAHSEAEAGRELLYAADVRLANEAILATRLPEALTHLNRHIPSPGQTDLREFAWRYLYGLCHQEVQVLHGHQGAVYGLAYSPDGQTIASVGRDDTLRLWDARTGTCRKIVDGQQGEMNAVAYSPNGELLATAGDDRTVRFWHPESAQPRGVLVGHQNEVYSLAFSSDGRWLASGGLDRALRLWDVKTQTLERELETTGDVRAIAFSPDTSLLVAGDDSGRVHCWRTSDWQELSGFRTSHDDALALAFSDRSSTLLSGGRSKVVRALRHSDEGLEHVTNFPQLHTERISVMAFSSAQNLFASAAWDGVIRIWSPDTDQRALTIVGHEFYIRAMAWSHDGTHIVSTGNDGAIKIWDIASMQLEYPAVPSPIEDIDYSNDGKQLVAACSDGYVRLWDTDTRELVVEHFAHPKGAGAVCLSPDATRVASRGNDGATSVCDVRTGKVLYSLPAGHSKPHAPLDWSKDGKLLATTEDIQTIVIVDAASGSVLRRIPHATQLFILLFSPDVQHLAIASNSPEVRSLYSSASVKLESTTGAEAYSPDGTILAASDSTSITLLDAQTGRARQDLVGHRGRFMRSSFSPDGRTLATLTRGTPMTVSLWDLRTGQELVAFPYDGKAEDIRFSPRGDRLVVAGASEDGTGMLREWRVPTVR